jgi:hypothetical protein
LRFTIGTSKIPEFLPNAAVPSVADKRLSPLQRPPLTVPALAGGHAICDGGNLKNLSAW